MSEFLLEALDLHKSFGETRANCGATLRVRPGEIHGLVGENGAGKSTLVSALCGGVRPDRGEIRWRGSAVAVRSPAHSRALGIGAVFQHFALFDRLTALENIILGSDRGTRPAETAARARALSGQYGLAVSLERPALSAGEKQRVEIIRCLLRSPRLIILDEPTSALAPQECARLFDLLRKLAGEGRGILFISHKLAEVEALCGEATVLRRGRSVATIRPREIGRAEVVRLMVGEESDLTAPRSPAAAESPPPLLEARNLRSGAGARPLRVDHLALRPGRVTGVAGIAGNGQDELLDALSGERPTSPSSTLSFNGRPAGDWGVRRRRRAGILASPAERRGRAAATEMTLAENALLGAMRPERFARRGFVDRAKTARFASEIAAEFGVRPPDATATAGALSGGNLQKFVMGRAILQRPAALLAANPTWGVDVRAAAVIHRALLRLRNDGAAVMIISEDLDEIFALSDDIAVMNAGRLLPAVPADSASREDIGRKMTEAQQAQGAGAERAGAGGTGGAE